MPYHFLIADGQVQAALAELLSNSKEIFPNLNIEYVRYPNDISFTRYFVKMSDVLSRVRTPYVMLADNDDFLAPTGIDGSLEFLERSSDYVCCGGGIAGFSIYSPPGMANPGLRGPLNKLSFRYAKEDRSQDLGQTLLVDRLVAGSQYSWGFYAVYRTAALAQVWREVVEIDFSDLMLCEWFCGMRTLTLGKACSKSSTIGYMRQYWTSMRSSFSEDWVHHLLRSRFTEDFTTLIDRLSKVISQADGIDAADAGERLRQTFDGWYRGFLRHNYGPSGIVRQYLRENMPAFLMWLKTRRRYGVLFERKRLLAELFRQGASSKYLDEFRREVAALTDVLTGDDFSAFLRSHISAIAHGQP